MKVLMLTGSYRPEVGGIAEVMSGFAAALVQRGLQVNVLAATPGASRFSTASLPVTEFELPARGYSKRVLQCRRAVSSLLRQSSFDRVIASSWSPFAVSIPGRLKRRTPALDIFCHGMDLLEPSSSLRYRMLMRRTLQRADKILANSHYTAKLAQAMGAKDGDVVVMHPGVDSKTFTPGTSNPTLLARHEIPPNAPVLLSVGRLVERKGFDMVIRALPMVQRAHPSVVYLIVGDGPDRERLSDLAKSMGVSQNVRFTGNIPAAERVAYYQLATLFVMPNRLIPENGDVEGFGVVFLEAAACELPSVGGDSGGVPDAIQNGVTGFLVDPLNPKDCAEKISLLLGDEETRKKMGKVARARVRTEFNWPDLVTAYLSQLS
ncbi:MAG TPA: glycosyltransferase family 4 protein [Acidobacteriota bacterium]|jgi:phosphatidylinositol alpha-1,6-mannosyltransferase